MNAKPGRPALQAILERCGIRLAPEQYGRLWSYHRLLRAANAVLNLTRIHNFENMVLKHYVDSLLVLGFTDLPSPLVDMGSGPGLPGIPLAIARPEVTFLLAEPRGPRAEFLRRVVAALSLPNVEVHAGRVGPQFTRPVRGVITRAVAPVAETLERVLPCLEPGGRVLLMKGPECDAEIAEADSRFPGTFGRVADHAYTIPETPHRRRLVIYERTDGDRHSSAGAIKAPARLAPPVHHAGPIRDVTSAANPMFQRAADLLNGRGVRKHGKALIAGPKIVAEVLAHHPERAEAWITAADGPPPPEEARLTWLRLGDALFRRLDASGTHAPILLVATPEMPVWSDADAWPPGCTLFVPLQDPENVGAVVRSAAAFAVGRVVLLKEAAHPFHPKASRAAGPALFQVPLELGPSIQELRVEGAPLYALSAEGADIAADTWPERFGLVVGVEGPGLPVALRQGGATLRRIPIAPGVESLNAAAAAAVALFSWRRHAGWPPGPPAARRSPRA
jgi:16S rRNA (guanine(527)-N(7))-methyltransferase RsmG